MPFLLLVFAARAEVLAPGASDGASSGGSGVDPELVGIIAAVLAVVIKLGQLLWLGELPRGARLRLGGGAGPGVVAGLGQDLTAAEVFGTRPPLLADERQPEDPAAIEQVGQRMADVSIPLLLELATELYRRLLQQRALGDLGPYRALVSDGAGEALLARGGALTLERVEVGPARLVEASVPDLWAMVDVELFALVDETWNGQARRRLRRDRLRLRRPRDTAPVAHSAALAALDASAGDLLLPADVDGWVLLSFVAEESEPPTDAALGRVDGPEASSVGRPSRLPSPELALELRGHAGRHPEPALPELLSWLEGLAEASLRARTGAAVPGLDPALGLRVRRLHAFWAAAGGIRRADLRVGGLQPLRVYLDPWCELLDVLIEISGEDPPVWRHREVWTLGRRVGEDPDWRVLAIAWAPASIA